MNYEGQVFWWWNEIKCRKYETSILISLFCGAVFAGKG